MYPRQILSLAFLLLFSACAQGGMNVNKSTGGALAGAALGSGLGAIVGSQTGHAGPGIAVGAAAGAIGGALIGNSMDAQDREQQRVNSQIESNDRQIAENRRLIDELRRTGADVYGSSRGVVINLPDVLFEFDSSRLTRDAGRTVGEIGNVLQRVQGRTIAVEGHADAKGSESYNYRLSENRARSVADALRYEGVPAGQMRVRGYGEGRPIASNDSEIGRARNRRVEVIIEN